MNDDFESTTDSIIAPARRCFEITPSDGDDLLRVTKGIYVGGGGDVRIMPLVGEEAVTYRNLADGSYIAVRVKRVLATGTTATSLIG